MSKQDEEVEDLGQILKDIRKGVDQLMMSRAETLKIIDEKFNKFQDSLQKIMETKERKPIRELLREQETFEDYVDTFIDHRGKEDWEFDFCEKHDLINPKTGKPYDEFYHEKAEAGYPERLKEHMEEFFKAYPDVKAEFEEELGSEGDWFGFEMEEKLEKAMKGDEGLKKHLHRPNRREGEED